jgi:hypothetical protein
MRVFLAGGTGKIGKRLLPHLQKRGDEVVLLTRNQHNARTKVGPGPELVEGDPMQPGSWMERISGCDAVINLVGEDIFGKRWNDAFKALLRDSRLKSTANIVDAICKALTKPAVLVQGSAIGYYGFHEDELLTEDSPPGHDFLAQLCVEWERAAQPVADAGVRLALVRTGIVLDKAGGALQAVLTPFRLGAGGKQGSGKQWMSWIHYDDEVGLLLFAADHKEVQGPLNATAPVPVTNLQFAKALGAALGRPSFLPTPGVALKALLGEVADLVVKGARILPKRAQELGYKFQYPDIDSALRAILSPLPASGVA